MERVVHSGGEHVFAGIRKDDGALENLWSGRMRHALEIGRAWRNQYSRAYWCGTRGNAESGVGATRGQATHSCKSGNQRHGRSSRLRANLMHVARPTLGAELKDTLTLAAPIVLAQVGHMSMGIVDTLVAGRIS